MHVGCFEVFGNEQIRSIAEGKSVGVESFGSPTHLFLSVIAGNVGIDPGKEINWVTSGPKIRPKQLFVDGKIDAFLGFPREPQEKLLYDKWRDWDAEDTMRFYALRMHEAGLIKSSPQKIIADNFSRAISARADTASRGYGLAVPRRAETRAEGVNRV